MSTRDRRTNERRILLAVSEEELAALKKLAPELELVAVAPNALARRTVDLRAHVAVWADHDADRGLRVLTRLQVARAEARLIYVTPAEAEAQRLAAIEAGIDEVVARPISATELVARIRLLARRARPARRSRLLIGDGLELDLDRRQLLRDDVWVHLRPKEAQLLELFARSPGRVLTRRHILERVWGPDHEGDPRTVDVHVRWLRSKMEPDPHAPVWLVTVRGAGYRLENLPLTER